MNVNGGLWGGRDQQEEGERKKRILRGEKDLSATHICI
jgi:hypothetical protein